MKVRTINFSDIMRNPNTSLSAKDYLESTQIKIDKNLAKELQDFLELEGVNMHELDISEDSVIEVFTGKFKDGFEADIKVCSGTENFFIDPVLFNPNGCEVCVLDSEGGDLLGEYIFEYENKQYIVELII